MTELSNESALVLRAGNGDREAFAELLEEHLPAVRAFLLRLGVAQDDLDDLTQEVFLTVIGGLKQFRGGSRFSTWLLGIALNTSRSWFRRRSPELGLPEDSAAPSDPPERRLLHREREERLDRALLELPRRLREAFVLRHVEQLPATEVANILRVPEGTVRRWTFQARKQLRSRLAPKESTHE
jgi:RNA polymerase sigma-70 factor (ECF subfamily)